MQRKSRRKSGAVKRKAVVGLDVGTTKIAALVLDAATAAGVIARLSALHPAKIDLMAMEPPYTEKMVRTMRGLLKR